jgi:hypothetical protein
MHARNIATCLFPTLFPVDSKEIIEQSGAFIDILCTLIEQNELIFRDETQTLKIIRQRELKSK